MNRSTIVAVATAALFPMGARSQSPDSGVKLFETKKFTEAKAVFAPAAAQNAEAAYYMGRIAFSENDDKATQWFEKAVKLNPNSSTYWDWLGRAYGNQAATVSKFRLPFLAPKVKGAFERAVALDPNNIDAREDVIQYYLRAPGFLGGSKQKARETAIEIKRRNAYRGGFDVANVCVEDKDYACVEREFDALKQGFSDSSGVYSQTAAYYANQKQFDKSFAILDARLRDKPGDMGATFGIGRTGALSGQNLDRAEKALKSYLATPPAVNAFPPANVHFRLGMVYEKQGKRDLARTEYTTSLQLNPKLEDSKRALEALRR